MISGTLYEMLSCRWFEDVERSGWGWERVRLLVRGLAFIPRRLNDRTASPCASLHSVLAQDVAAGQAWSFLDPTLTRCDIFQTSWGVPASVRLRAPAIRVSDIHQPERAKFWGNQLADRRARHIAHRLRALGPGTTPSCRGG